MAYLNRYKQVMLLRNIENKFGGASRIEQSGSPDPSNKYEGARTLAAAQRNRPVPGAGHYDFVNEQYFRATQ